MGTLWAKYYAENGEDLNRRRRRKYTEDEAYRLRVLKANANYRGARKRNEKAQKRGSVRMRRGGTWRMMEIEIDGVLTPMFTIGALAKTLGKGISTCRVWEKRGLLPETPHRSERGDRLYSVSDVCEIKKSLDISGKLSKNLRLRPKVRPDYVDREVRFSDGCVRKMRLYRIGTLSLAVGRTVVSLTQMEKAGRLPRTPLLGSKLGYRLYTGRMIEVVDEAFEFFDRSLRGVDQWRDFYNRIERGWRTLGVLDAEVTDNGKGKKDRRVGATRAPDRHSGSSVS